MAHFFFGKGRGLSKADTSIAQTVQQSVEPLLESQGYEVITVTYVPKSGLLRVFVDHEQGIGIDDCSRLSRLIGDLLDGEGLSDLIPQRFTLEVSSPGLDRLLVKPAHFVRFLGKEAKVRARKSEGKAQTYQGVLLDADNETVTIEADGQPCTLSYENIENARLVPDL